MCRIERTSLGGGVICARCSDDCECVVCIPLDEQTTEYDTLWDEDFYQELNRTW